MESEVIELFTIAISLLSIIISILVIQEDRRNK